MASPSPLGPTARAAPGARPRRRPRSGPGRPASSDPAPPRVVIEVVSPVVDGGALAAKALAGEAVPVRAAVYADGHDRVAALVRWRSQGGRWSSVPLDPIGNDEWVAPIRCDRVGAAEYQVVGWVDRLGSWLRDTRACLRAGQAVELQFAEGAELLHERMADVPPADRQAVSAVAEQLLVGAAGAQDPLEAADALVERLRLVPDPRTTTCGPCLPLWVERERAGVGAWYELFVRSEGAILGQPPRSGTFASAARRLPALAAMGFDVVYLAPIHPIGLTGRKGPNNTRPAGPHDPGSPWAIGALEGGHSEIHPDLGTVTDFEEFVARARDLGLEVALDLALQCSPDHPWVREHPDWFRRRPDGTIAHAENPPKAYEDIVPLDFGCPDWRALWTAVRAVVETWIARGVRVFRVDNPHTKPVALWSWLIGELRRDHPDVLLLAEAFTRPHLLWRLAKVGFSQSYTYFTWRQRPAELAAYALQLSEGTSDFLRPNLFVNTPDILTAELQEGGPPAFRLRLVLAATMSPSYGIYSGFELCENQAVRPGSEEYLDSEKYQLRPRDWDQPHSLAPLITAINAIRRRHPALQRLRGLTVQGIDGPNLIGYSRRSADGRDTVLVVVNLDPHHPREATTSLDLPALGLAWDASFTVRDELSGATYRWQGPRNYVRLDPAQQPAHIFAVEP